ncbi:MAG: hypothetical protein K9K76_07665 [Halanaerobiales bacterium]|nr:hypothetical protein [Halanaerobiales bacterium]
MKLSQLNKAWNEVGEDYCKGLINLEHCLQAAFYKSLRESLSEAQDIRIYVEPVIEYYDKGSPRYRPDIVVCEDKHITAIIEFKFAPNWYPDIGSDIKKFEALVEDEDQEKYYVERYPDTGKWKEPKYFTSSSTKYIIAVIGQEVSQATDINSIIKFFNLKESVKKRFYLLAVKMHGENQEPEILVESI